MHNSLIAWSIKLGNMLDVYDVAYYVFIIPLIGPELLGKDYKLSFLLLSGGVIVRPMGAIFFSQLALKYSAIKLLRISLSGTSVATFLMALVDLKSYYALSSIILLRLLQGFFAAAEGAIASLYVLHIAPSEKRVSANGRYISFTLLGYLLASLSATFVVHSTQPLLYWKIPFLIGGIATFSVVLLRSFYNTVPHDSKHINVFDFKKSMAILWSNKQTVLRVAIVSGFDVLTYYFIFIFCLEFIPAVSHISKATLYSFNNILLIFDIVVASVIAKALNGCNRKKWLIITSIAFTIVSTVSLAIFQYANVELVVFIRGLLVVLAVSYASILKPWLLDVIQGPSQFLIINTGYYLGSDLIGKIAPAVCLGLYYYFNNSLAPSFYIIFVLILTLTALLIKDSN